MGQVSSSVVANNRRLLRALGEMPTSIKITGVFTLRLSGTLVSCASAQARDPYNLHISLGDMLRSRSKKQKRDIAKPRQLTCSGGPLDFLRECDVFALRTQIGLALSRLGRVSAWPLLPDIATRLPDCGRASGAVGGYRFNSCLEGLRRC